MALNSNIVSSTNNLQAIYDRAVAGGYEVILSPEDAAVAENYPPDKEMVLLEPGGHRLIIVQPPAEE